MTKTKFAFLMLFCLIMFSSCTKIVDINESQFTLKNITKQIEAAGVDLKSNDLENPRNLKDVLPHVFSIGINEDDGSNWEYMYIYL